MKRIHLTIPGNDIQLEGCWHFPEGAGTFPAVVVCHPHPLHGGDMNNNVVFNVCETMAAGGIAALRFNYRGVGNSGGQYGEGIGERDDVRAALSLARVTGGIDTGRLGLCGYSFGAHVAVPVASEDADVKQLALISPYLTGPEWAQLERFTRPLYIIHGEQDFVISSEAVRRHLDIGPGSGSYEVLEGADHYLIGREAIIAEKVAGFFFKGFNHV